MPIKSLKPSIAFNGTCAQAIALYESALGAATVRCVRFADGAKMGHAFDESDAHRILNATLRIGDSELDVMDTPASRAVAADTNVAVSIELDDPDELDTRFAALSNGGKVTMPVENTFWGARFGMLQDAFGVRWMLSHTLAKR